MVKIAFFVMSLGAPICWILLSFEWTYFPSSCFSLLQYYWRFLWIAFKKQKSQFFNKSQFRSNYHVTGGWYQTSKENSVYQCDGFKVDLQLVWKLREELKILMGGRGLTILNCTSIIYHWKHCDTLWVVQIALNIDNDHEKSRKKRPSKLISYCLWESTWHEFHYRYH